MAFLSPGMTAGLAAGAQGGDIATEMLQRQLAAKRLQQQMQDEDQARKAKALIGQVIQGAQGNTPPINIKQNYNPAQPAFPDGNRAQAQPALPQGPGGQSTALQPTEGVFKWNDVLDGLRHLTGADPSVIADAVAKISPEIDKESERESRSDTARMNDATKRMALIETLKWRYQNSQDQKERAQLADQIKLEVAQLQADSRERTAQIGAGSREKVAEIGAGSRVDAAQIAAKAREYGADTVANAKAVAADAKFGAEQRKAAQTVALVGDTTDKLIQNIKELIDDPGLDEAFGPKQGLLPNWAAGAKAVQARKRLEAIQGGQMRAQLAQMRTVGGSTGLGRVLMAELPALQSSFEALDKQMEPDQIRQALQKLIGDVAQVKASAVDRYTETYKNQRPASGTKGEGVKVYKQDEIPGDAKTFELPPDHKYAQEPDGFQTKTKDGLWQKFGNKMILVAPNAAGE